MTQRDLAHAGSTAVVCLIDTQKNLIYTATLGDSEANLYAASGATRLQSIPLSVLGDLENDKQLLIKSWDALEPSKKEFCLNLLPATYPKQRRIGSINMSRVLGDLAVTNALHKPHVSVTPLQAGDTLVIACDGLKDFVSEQEVIDCLEGNYTPQAELYHEIRSTCTNPDDPTSQALEEKAQQIVERALENKSDDNITVMTVRF